MMSATLRSAILLVGLLLVASAASAPVAAEEAQQTPYPRHVDLATLGTVLGMRGQSASERGLPVRFSSDVQTSLVEPEFHYEGFYLHQILIGKVATINGQPGGWRVQGLLVFEDVAGRRAYAKYSTYYRVLNDGIEITRSAARAFTPPEPTIIWFALHRRDVPDDMLVPESHAELIKLAATRSLDRVPSSTGDYVVFALSMDRLAPSEQMASIADMADLEIVNVNLGGWPVGVFSGQMDPSDIADKLSVKLEGDIFSTDMFVLQRFPTRPFEWDGGAP